jgi:hypothetical protein
MVIDIFLQAAWHMTNYIECMSSYCCWQSRKPAWIESIASKGKWSHEVMCVCVCVCVCFAGPLQLNWIEFTAAAFFESCVVSVT